jgi:6,7-dimethyl-8-ribityllumazine synthase
MSSDKPVLFGVLTCDTLQQARDRALPEDEGGKEDKGREIARAAIDVLCSLDEIGNRKTSSSIGFGSSDRGISL